MVVRRQYTINYDNWKLNTRHECTSKLQFFRRNGCEWHCYHCARLPHVKMDDIRARFGPVDAHGQSVTFAECSYYECPAIRQDGGT